jgi:SNF family Na+-dependent transporter
MPDCHTSTSILARSTMATVLDRIAVRWEASYPALCGVAGAVLGYTALPRALEQMHHKQWVIENIFVAVFTLGTVTAGFGLAIYTFLLTTESGFIGRAKQSIYYRHLLRYVLLATILSAGLAIASIPGMVIKEAPHPHSIHALYTGLWACIVGWTGGALFRAGHLFAIFARQHH